MESRNDVVWAKSMEPYSCAWLCMAWDGGECRGFHLHAGFFIDDSMLLVLKAQEISLHFPPCHDRYDTPMYARRERTERTESVDKLPLYELWPMAPYHPRRR